MISQILHKIGALGLIGSIKLAQKNLAQWLIKIHPEVRRRQKKEKAFDIENSVDTSSNVIVDDLDVEKEISKHCVHYEPTRVWLFEEIFANISVDYKEYTMIDVGSGKGRVLILASKFPFKQIIGVEISKILHKIAIKNIEIHSNKSKISKKIILICKNIDQYDIPNDNVLLFLYNPFDAFFMKNILNNLKKHHETTGKKIILIYVNPVHSETIEIYNFLKQVKCNQRYIIYSNK